MKTSKVTFTIVTMLHSNGEIEFSETEDLVFIHPVHMTPVVTLIGADALSEEDKARAHMMALHQLITAAANKLRDMDKKVTSSSPINMAPTAGETN